jgi:hypothetical protein
LGSAAPPFGEERRLWALPELVGVADRTVVVVAAVGKAGAEDPFTLVPGVGSKSIQP